MMFEDSMLMAPTMAPAAGAPSQEKIWTNRCEVGDLESELERSAALTNRSENRAEGTGFDPAVCRNVKHPRILPQKFFSQQRLQSFGQSRSLPIVWHHLAMISAQFQHSRSQTPTTQ